MLRQLVIHNSDQLRVRPVIRCEVSATEQWNSHSLKVIAVHGDRGRQIQVGILGGNVALDYEGTVAVAAGSWQEGCDSDGFDAGDLLNTADELVVELVGRSLRGILLPRQRVRRR